MSYAAYLAGPERRRRILDCAKRVFARRGYHDTNISHICEDLKIARGTLYQYFQSKKDVFVAIVEETLERVKEAVAKEPPVVVPPGVLPTRERVLRYSASSLHRVLQAVFADEASLRIMVREAVGLDVGIDKILHAIDDIVIERMASDMRAARDAGILRADVEPRTAALFVLGGVQKLALDALSRDDSAGPEGERSRTKNVETPIDLRALADEATRMNLLGLLSPEVT